MAKTNPRITNVQVPGEDPKPTTGPADAEQQDGIGAAAAEASPSAEDKAVARLTRPTRAQYATMRADEVDPSTLSHAVLTADGWVCPPTIATLVK